MKTQQKLNVSRKTKLQYLIVSFQSKMNISDLNNVHQFSLKKKKKQNFTERKKNLEPQNNEDI